jgi:exodeoxyribonuclease VII large subunit
VQSCVTYSVSEITKYIKSLLRSDASLLNVWVRGEISNFKAHSSGHLYFSLKDEASRLKCVMFKGSASSLRFIPSDGMSVVAVGSIDVYERNGEYQFYVDLIEPDGLGSLYLAFIQLQERLAREGLFDQAAKQPLPSFVQTVGVITSPTGAAVQDIIKVARRRFPGVKIVIVPALVQGPQAPQSIVQALKTLNEWGLVDVIILARGGGSIEELWSFNDEHVARAIFESVIPVVSAVGHETDFTISDLVADCRAPTPSAAAELVIPDAVHLKQQLAYLRTSLVQSLGNIVRHNQLHIEMLQRISVLSRPDSLLSKWYESVDSISEQVISAMEKVLMDETSKLTSLSQKLAVLDPMATLERGYAIVRSEDRGRIVKSVAQVKHGSRITIDVRDGTFEAEVTCE